MEAFVKSEIKNGIGTITFFHPQSNSMPGLQLTNLAKEDRKSTRLNSSHVAISYAVFCLKKKKIHCHDIQDLRPTETGGLADRHVIQLRQFAIARILLETFSTTFFFTDTSTTEIYTLSLHDALPI